MTPNHYGMTPSDLATSPFTIALNSTTYSHGKPVAGKGFLLEN